jgi:superfamily I DNA/RNA helicase
MFGNTKEGEAPKVLTLSTVHKSKGREWTRVYALGRAKFMPSPYAKKEWQMVQESNLEYVMITRAMSEFIDVPMSEKE